MSLGQLNSRAVAGAGILFTVHTLTAEVSAPATVSGTFLKIRGFVAGITDTATMSADDYVLKRTLPTTITATSSIPNDFTAKRALTVEIAAMAYFYPRIKVMLRAEIVSGTTFAPVMADKILWADIISAASITPTLLRKQHPGLNVDASSTFTIADEVITRYFSVEIVDDAEIWAPFKIKRTGDSFWTFDCHVDVAATSAFYIQPGWFVGPGGAVFVRAGAELTTTLIAWRDLTAEIAPSAVVTAPLMATLDLTAGITPGAVIDSAITRSAGFTAEIQAEAEILWAKIYSLYKVTSAISSPGTIESDMKKQRGFVSGIAATAVLESTLLNKKPLLANCIDGDTLEGELKVLSIITAAIACPVDVFAFMTINSEIPAPSYRTMYVSGSSREVILSEEARTVEVV